MKQPEVFFISLENGGTAIVVNGRLVQSLDAGDQGPSLADVAGSLAAALNVELQSISMPVPPDSDWNWDDVIELLPASDARFLSSIPVRHWGHYDFQPEAPFNFVFDCDDQRQSNGQMFCDIGAIEGGDHDIIGVTMEINKSPIDGVTDVPCVHLHFDGDNVAFSAFKIGSRILLRPETQVSIDFERIACANGITEDMYWVD